MRLPMVRRADGLKRDDSCVGSLTSGVSWNVSTPNVSSTTLPISPEMGLVEQPRGARLNQLLLGQIGALQRRQIGVLRGAPRRRAAATRSSPAGSGGSDVNSGRSRCIVPVARSVTRYGWSGHAHLRLGRHIERGLDADGVVEVERARA